MDFTVVLKFLLPCSSKHGKLGCRLKNQVDRPHVGEKIDFEETDDVFTVSGVMHNVNAQVLFVECDTLFDAAVRFFMSAREVEALIFFDQDSRDAINGEVERLSQSVPR